MSQDSKNGSGSKVIGQIVDKIKTNNSSLDDSLIQCLSLDEFPIIKDSDLRQIDISIERCRVEGWQNYLRSWKAAAMSYQKYRDDSGQILASEVNLAKADLVPPLLECVRIMTRIASSQDLWATKILSQNCADLSSLVCTIRDKAASEEAAAVVRQAFRITVSDNESEESLQGRTLKCYDVAVCLLRIYTSLHAYPLAEGILSAVKQYTGSIPDLSQSHWKVQSQFLFYRGLFSFYDQKYTEATRCFEDAVEAANALTSVQLEHILVFLIPSKYLSANRAPTEETWGLSTRLRDLYRPLIEACRAGDYQGYLSHLKKHGETLRKNRLYLACDSMLPQLRLNLLRRVWLTLGAPKRVPLDAYLLGLRLCKMIPANSTDQFFAEYYISQSILKGEVKGYIHHELGLLMLSKSKPFPNLVSHGTVEA